MFRSSHRRCSIKKLPFAMFTGKYLCWSLYLKKLLIFRPATLLKGDSSTSAFLWILRNFLRAPILKNICKRQLLIVLLKDCENPTGTASFLIPDFSIFSLTKDLTNCLTWICESVLRFYFLNLKRIWSVIKTQLGSISQTILTILLKFLNPRQRSFFTPVPNLQ